MSDENWNAPVTTLKGVGPKQGQLFGQLGVFTVKDLMHHFPFRFEDISERDINTILDGEKVTLKGKIVTPPVVNYFGGKKNRLNFRFAIDETTIIQVSFFNQPYLAKQLELGQTIGVYGKWQEARQSLLGMRIINAADGPDFNPVYPSTKGLSQTQITKAIKQAFEEHPRSIEEIVPQILNDHYRLMPLEEALYQMHFPTDKETHQQAERKIIYQEFFLYQWRLALSRQQNQDKPGQRIMYDVDELREVIEAIPFELTKGQKQAVNEICYDLLAKYPMQRLLQGDVGSGKTLVAFITMIAAVQAGFQTALLVPTEILAKQHVISFNNFFESIGLHAEILIGAMTAKEKREVLEGLEKGRIRIVIGTHALIQESVIFNNLGYIVIDEQHRFGVNQRQSLLDKGQGVNYVQMTATPIPRSLALSIYGEMAVSTIQERPKGRLPIITRWLEDPLDNQLDQHIQQTLDEGHQIYYVLPLIEESEHMTEIENVLAVQERLQFSYPNYQIGVLHGQMDKNEQENAMQAFKNNETHILVATTMVEVGVDVPNSTLMIIQSAERFGLAQLHQLRGRVGRNDLQSYCYLIAQPKTEQGKQRMEIMTSNNDGFVISQEDMKLRGIGDVLGLNQSGLPQFSYANMIEDQAVLLAAQEDVRGIIEQPTRIEIAEFDRLNEEAKRTTIQI
ncbi:ATP-dependent DNA helicase RecG [Aerococcaceae bacterium DSM 111022]|nr:ATP-dependent DNA helicase RecG [Aerococcaceae bacterium DSM 111022]